MRLATKGLLMMACAIMFTSSARAQEMVEVTFRLDMSALIDSCQHDVTTDTIAVRGDFNEWSDTGDWTLLEPSEEDETIFEATIETYADSSFGYKFWTSRGIWENDPNRTYTPTTEAEQVLPVATFRQSFDNICEAAIEDVEVTFRVNMGVQINAGDFDPETDIVVVAGTLNNWTTTADTLLPDFADPDIYAGTFVAENVPVPGEINFKFVTGTEGGEAPGGWEGGSDRVIEITGEEERNSEGQLSVTLDPVPYFNRISPDQVFSQDVTVTIRVDARPAYYFLADSGYVPSDVQTSEEVEDFSNVYINGPISNIDDLGDWYGWGDENLGQLESRRADVSEESDSVFVWTRTFRAYQAREWVGKFGLDGHDNENGVGADHRFIFPDEAESTVDVIFGAAWTGEEWRVDLYDAYIGFEDGEPFVQRRSTGVSIEPTGELPTTIALKQNYPNPFNPSTTFEYQLDKAQHVSLKVFDVLGRQVATLVDEVQAANSYRVTFDGTDLSSGMYLYQLQTGGHVLTRTMTLLK